MRLISNLEALNKKSLDHYKNIGALWEEVAGKTNAKKIELERYTHKEDYIGFLRDIRRNFCGYEKDKKRFFSPLSEDIETRKEQITWSAERNSLLNADSQIENYEERLGEIINKLNSKKRKYDNCKGLLYKYYHGMKNVLKKAKERKSIEENDIKTYWTEYTEKRILFDIIVCAYEETLDLFNEISVVNKELKSKGYLGVGYSQIDKYDEDKVIDVLLDINNILNPRRNSNIIKFWNQIRRVDELDA